MIVDDLHLLKYRDANGLCRLRLNRSAPKGGFRYRDYPVLLRALTEEPRHPLLLQRGLRFSPTYSWFEGPVRDNSERNVVAVLAFTYLVPALPVVANWLALQHQCAGYTCRQLYLIGTVLEPREETLSAFRTIAEENYFACGGWFERHDTDSKITKRYLKRLAELGMTCSRPALEELCESVYPIDATRDVLAEHFIGATDLLYLCEEDVSPVILLLTSNSD
jgi:hypothetical protein